MVKRKKGSKSSTSRSESEAEAETATFSCGLILPPKKKGGGKRKGSAVNLELVRTTLYPRRVWVIEDFLGASECAAWISHGESAGFEDVGHAESYEVAFRDNGRIEFTDEGVAELIWERLKRFIPGDLNGGMGSAVGCHSKIRVYRYVKGQRFGKHVDESDSVGDGKETGATVLIYLNGDDLRGGETVFYRDHSGREVATEVKPMAGALLFHGYVDRIVIRYTYTNSIQTRRAVPDARSAGSAFGNEVCAADGRGLLDEMMRRRRWAKKKRRGGE